MSDEHPQRLRESCGGTGYDHMTTYEKVVIGLQPKFACSKIKQIVAASELSNYDIAEDSHRWHSFLKVLLAHTQRYNLGYIFRVLYIVNLADGFSIEKANDYINILTEWKLISLENSKRWQEFVSKYGSRVNIKSDDWMMGVLKESMEPNLKVEICANMEDIPIYQQGVIMMFYLITKHIFACNQEANDTTKKYMINFDIHNFDSENISKAIINGKAIDRALGDNWLSNVVQ